MPGEENSPPAPRLVLQGDQCVDAPYRFLSFLPSYAERGVRGCGVEVYTKQGCEGQGARLGFMGLGSAGVESGDEGDEGVVRSGVCAFQGGRSVKMNCRGVEQRDDLAGK